MGQLNYCPLIWTFCSRRSNNLINKLQERALRMTFRDYESSFSELLEIANETTIHIRNIRTLMIETYKFLNDLSPPIIADLFQKNECSYSLRNTRLLSSKHKSTLRYGIDTVSYKGPKIWHNLPQEIRNSQSLNLFKSKIKEVRQFCCQCKICRTFIPNLGYID